MKPLNYSNLRNSYSALKENKIFAISSSIAASIPAAFSFFIWLNVFSQENLLILSRFKVLQPVAVLFAIFFCLLAWMTIAGFLISACFLWNKKTTYKSYALIVYIFSFSVIASTFWMLVFYPGVMSYDATLAWEQALNNQYNAWHPPILAMLMHLTQKLVNNPSLFTNVQGMLFWSSTFYLLWQVIHYARLFIASTIIISFVPQIWLYSNAAISNTSMAAFMMLASAFLIRSLRVKCQRSFATAIVCLSLAICFRREAILLAIIPIGCVFFIGWNPDDAIQNNIQKTLKTILLIIVLLVVPAKLIEMNPNVTGRSPASYVFLSQYVGTITRADSNISESEIQAEAQSIDREFGAGTFELLMGEGFECQFPRVWIRNIRLANKEEIILDNPSFVVKKAANMMLQHPVAYAEHKICNFSYVLQIPEVNYQDWGGMGLYSPALKRAKQLNIGLDSQIPLVQENYGYLMQWMLNNSIARLTFRHYIFYIVSLLALFIGVATRRVEWIIPALFSVVYSFGNLIPDSFPLWRYLFPCYTLAWVCLLAILSYLAKKKLPNLF